MRLASVLTGHMRAGIAQSNTVLAASLGGITTIPWIVLLVVVAFLLLAGTFMDSTVLILMLTSLLIPVVQQIGIDLVHFGIVVVLTLTIGLLTPPEGAVLYIICTIFRCRIWDFVREGWLMMLSIVVVVLMVVFWPDLALWLWNPICGKE